MGYVGLYEISDLGRVRSLRRRTSSGWRGGRVRKACRAHNGYLQVSLSSGGLRVNGWIHQMVAEAFIGPRPPGMQIRHLDGDPANNQLSNIAYGTPSENAFDAVRHGRNRQALQTHCVNGHEFDSANTYIRPSGARDCRACIRKRARSYQARVRGAA